MLINSVSGLSQYKIGNKTVTIFGEYHDETSLCGGVNVSVAEWCEDRLNKNPRASVLLEYNENMDPVDLKTYGSAIVRYTFNRETLLRSHAKGIDIRLDYLSMDEQQLLYHGTRGFSPEFANAYNLRKSPGPILDHSVCGKYAPCLDLYIKKIDDMFTSHISNGHVNLLTMQWAWSFLMDYRILWEITRTDAPETDEIIAVVGENHRTNLRDILAIWGVESINEISGSCINANEIKTHSV